MSYFPFLFTDKVSSDVVIGTDSKNGISFRVKIFLRNVINEIKFKQSPLLDKLTPAGNVPYDN